MVLANRGALIIRAALWQMVWRSSLAAGSLAFALLSRKSVSSPANPNPPKHDPGDGFLTRNLLGPMVKRVLRAHYADLAIVEDMMRDSGLDWTSIRPSRLTDKKPTGRYRTAIGQNLRGGTTVSRADVADLMLRVLNQPETIGRTIGIAD